MIGQVFGRRINWWLLLGVALGAGVLLLGGWLVAVIGNRFVSIAWSMLVLAMLVAAFYPRHRWPRRARRVS